jgi:serine/threonine protein kinase
LKKEAILTITNDLIREANLLSSCDHVNIVKFYGVSYEESMPKYLVMEFMNLGDLRSYLIKIQSTKVKY